VRKAALLGGGCREQLEPDDDGDEMAYIPPGVAPREEGGPAGGTDNSRSQVAVAVAVGTVYSVQYLPPGVAPREKGGPAGGAENSWSQMMGMRWLTYRLA
jgi:hypothetical protein